MKKLLNRKILKVGLYCLVLFGLFLPSLATAAWEWGGDRDWGREAGLPEEDLEITVQNVVRWFLSALSLIAVVMIIIGGFKWMMAGGNEEKVTKAKNLIQATIIGLVIILLSWAIYIFVAATVLNATT